MAGAAGLVVEGVCGEGRTGLFGGHKLFGFHEAKASAETLIPMKSVVSLSKDSLVVALWKR